VVEYLLDDGCDLFCVDQGDGTEFGSQALFADRPNHFALDVAGGAEADSLAG
jgi:hypothetical protein